MDVPTAAQVVAQLYQHYSGHPDPQVVFSQAENHLSGSVIQVS